MLSLLMPTIHAQWDAHDYAYVIGKFIRGLNHVQAAADRNDAVVRCTVHLEKQGA